MIHVTWKDIEKNARLISNQVKESGYDVDAVVGIGTSGFIPTTLISHELNIKNVSTVTAHSYKGRTREPITVVSTPNTDLSDKNILLIDDNIESGETMRTITSLLEKDYNVKEVKTATLVVNKTLCKKYPDFYGAAVERNENEWILFPWDKEGKYT